MSTIFLSHPPGMRDLYYGPRALRGLQEIGHVILNPHEAALSSPEVATLASDAEFIVSYRQTVGDALLLRALPRLKAFVRCAVDIRNVDVPAASALGILVTQASAGFVPAVAEWVVGAMIDLGRSTTAYASAYRSGVPLVPHLGRELRHATLGLVGYGQIGRYLGDLAVALGMRIIVHDPHVASVQAPARQAGFAELLSTSDFVVCLAGATDATHHLFDAKAFAAMRPDAFFINASRGSLVDEKALLEALDVGAIAGCALDVGQAPDQMPSAHVARHPRVIATPHVGGLTLPAIEHQAMETVMQITEIVAGREPKGAVNATEAFRWRTSPQNTGAAPC